MEQKYWFFGSKLNTALLLILIILMVVALRYMMEDKERYFPKSDTTVAPSGQTTKTAEWGGVAFSYPTDWQISPKHAKMNDGVPDLTSKQTGIILQGPSSENQVILVGERSAYTGNDTNLYEFNTVVFVDGVMFVLSKYLTGNTEDVFNGIVSSAKKI